MVLLLITSSNTLTHKLHEKVIILKSQQLFRAIKKVVGEYPPRKPNPNPYEGYMLLSGLEPFRVGKDTNFVNIGERCNVAGCNEWWWYLFLRDYILLFLFQEALQIAKEQVENGAQILDIVSWVNASVNKNF